MRSLRYVSSQTGGAVELDGPSLWTRTAPKLRSRRWGYTLGSHSATGVSHVAREEEFELVATSMAALDEAERLFDADLAAGEPGTLVAMGEWTQKAYIVETEPDVISPMGVTANAKAILLDGAWRRITKYRFEPHSAEQSQKVNPNLVKNSAEDRTVYGYAPVKYELAADLVEGETYTITVWADVNSGQHVGVWRYETDPDGFIDDVPATGDGVFSGTAQARATTGPAKNTISIWNRPYTTASEMTVHRVKLERGVSATPWTPAAGEEGDDGAGAGNVYVEGLDFGTADFPFDYANTPVAASSIDVPEDGALARITFYGPCASPYVRIGTNIYGVDSSAQANERIVIDPTGKHVVGSSVYRVGRFGETANLYDARRRGTKGSGTYVFERLEPGEGQPVSWPQSFGCDVEVIEERGEPPWS